MLALTRLKLKLSGDDDAPVRRLSGMLSWGALGFLVSVRAGNVVIDHRSVPILDLTNAHIGKEFWGDFENDQLQNALLRLVNRVETLPSTETIIIGRDEPLLDKVKHSRFGSFWVIDNNLRRKSMDSSHAIDAVLLGKAIAVAVPLNALQYFSRKELLLEENLAPKPVDEIEIGDIVRYHHGGCSQEVTVLDVAVCGEKGLIRLYEVETTNAVGVRGVMTVFHHQITKVNK